MFSKIQIFYFEKYEIKENDNSLYDCNLQIYLDSNNNIIYKDFKILKQYSKRILLKKSKWLNMIIKNAKLMKKEILL